MEAEKFKINFKYNSGEKTEVVMATGFLAAPPTLQSWCPLGPLPGSLPGPTVSSGLPLYLQTLALMVPTTLLNCSPATRS